MRKSWSRTSPTARYEGLFTQLIAIIFARRHDRQFCPGAALRYAWYCQQFSIPNKAGERRGASMPKLQVIIGSTRPTRAADHVAPWVINRAERHEAFEVEALDLRDWPLPIFQEHVGTLGDFVDPPYSEPIVKRLS